MSTRKIGDKVFDMPSQKVCTIIDIDTMEVEGHAETYFQVDAPDNATGDGAFPNGWRCEFEICDPDKTLPLEY